MSEHPSRPLNSASLATAVTEVGRRLDARIVTANLPVFRASSVFFETLEDAYREGAGATAGVHHATSYATAGTPTTFALMDALAEIEGHGHACRAALMPSGLAAIAAALLAVVKTGDHVLMPDSVYGPGRTFANGMLSRMGVRTTFYAPGLSPTRWPR
jgi:cystathionine beta-lyase